MSCDNRKKLLTQARVCERVKWSENNICRLVCLYKKYPCLWKKDNPSYMKNSSRHSAYSNIHQAMDMLQITFTEVMIKIREVRRIYVSELQKIFKAHYSGRKYEPRQKWFLTLHNFLYEYLDFDETAVLQALEDSASSSCREYDDEDFDDADNSDSETPPQSDYNPRSNFESFRKIPQRIPCDSSDAGSSLIDYSPPQMNSNRCQFIRTDSHASKVKKCTKKIVHCPQHETTTSSEICCKSFRPKKSTSITIICDKKSDYQSPRDAIDQNVQRKCCTSMKKEPSTLSCPKSSSIERFDSNGSLNTSLGKTPDEFDVFAKSVACQLRKMDIESAVMAQNQIQNFLTDRRLSEIQTIKPETSETKDLVLVQESASHDESLTPMRSEVIKPASSTSKRRLFTTKPVHQDSRRNESHILEPSIRWIAAKRLFMANEMSQRKTKKGLP